MMNLHELAERWFGHEPQHLTAPQQRVLRSAIERVPVARDPNETFEEQLSFGQRVADDVARVGGSWGFIISFCLFLVLWGGSNALLAARAFDPYPFIFLNLLLSMLAAIQAPIIMMAQNRQAQHDRIDAGHDYEVNLKAEIGIMALHDKLDQLRNDQLMTILGRIEALADEVRRLQPRHGTPPDSAREAGPAGARP